MTKNFLKECLGIGTIILFLVAIFIPSISGNFRKITNFSDIEIDIENNIVEKSLRGTDWWPMFHHDLQLTGFTSSIAPDTNSLLWYKSLGEDNRFSSPSIVDDLLYIGTGEIYGKYHIGSLDFLADYKNFFFLENQSFLNINCKIERTIQPENGTIYCLNAKSGQIVWSYPTVGSVYSCPIVADGNVYIVSSDRYTYFGDLYCLDAITGQKKWNKSVMTGYTTPIVSDGRLYLLEINPDDYYGNLLCYDASNGLKIWNHTTGYIDFSLFTSPALAGNKIYITSISVEGGIFCTMKCLNAKTGARLWETKLGTMEFGYALSSPIIDNDKAYVINAETEDDKFWCELNCLATSNGSILWNYTMKDKVDELSFSSPAVGYENVYFALIGDKFSYGKIICLNAEDGSLQWVHKSNTAYTLSSPVIGEEKIYIGGFDMSLMRGNLYCFDAFDGSFLWSSYVDKYYIESTPAIVDGITYVVSAHGEICAIKDVLEIVDIKGGLFSVKAEIANTGNHDLMNVDYCITVYGGVFIFKINITEEGTIDILEAHTSDIVKAIPVYGFGKIKIIITVSTLGISPFAKEKEGFAFGPFIYVY